MWNLLLKKEKEIKREKLEGEIETIKKSWNGIKIPWSVHETLLIQRFYIDKT